MSNSVAEIASKPVAAARSRKRLVLIVLPVLLVLCGVGLWFTGLVSALLHSARNKEGGRGDQAEVSAPQTALPSFVDMPEIIANLNAPGRRSAFLKLRAKLELARAQDQSTVQAVMPRLQDLFQTYLREMRPDELRGSAGTARLREELVARANIAVAPAHVADVLFTDLLVQ